MFGRPKGMLAADDVADAVGHAAAKLPDLKDKAESLMGAIGTESRKIRAVEKKKR